MKSATKLLTLAGLLANSGCVTRKVLDRTEPGVQWNARTGKDKLGPGNPAYYGLVPVAFVFDVATSPFWVPPVLYFAYSMSQPITPPPAPQASARQHP